MRVERFHDDGPLEQGIMGAVDGSGRTNAENSLYLKAADLFGYTSGRGRAGPGLVPSPGSGFLLRLYDVRWLGSYWPFGLNFKTRCIEWTDEGFAQASARAAEMGRLRAPRLPG